MNLYNRQFVENQTNLLKNKEKKVDTIETFKYLFISLYKYKWLNKRKNYKS